MVVGETLQINFVVKLAEDCRAVGNTSIVDLTGQWECNESD